MIKGIPEPKVEKKLAIVGSLFLNLCLSMVGRNIANGAFTSQPNSMTP